MRAFSDVGSSNSDDYPEKEFHTSKKSKEKRDEIIVTATSASCSEKGGEYKIYTELGEFKISAADYKALGFPPLNKENGFPCGIILENENELEFLDEKLRAVKYLSWYLTYGDKSEKALLAKLKEKDFSADAAQAATDLLKKNGILNEEAICKRKIEIYAETKYFGPRRIKQELRAKGFSENAVKRAMENACEEIDFDAVLEKLCLKLAKKKRISDRNKLYSMLGRYGFDYAEIKYAVNKFTFSNTEDCFEDEEK